MLKNNFSNKLNVFNKLFYLGLLTFLVSCSQSVSQPLTSKVVSVPSNEITANGKLTATNFKELPWLTDGIIEKVNFKVGDKVRQGDILAELKYDSLSFDIKESINQFEALKQNKEEKNNDQQLLLETADVAIEYFRSDMDYQKGRYVYITADRTNVDPAYIKSLSSLLREAKENLPKKTNTAAYEAAFKKYQSLSFEYHFYNEKFTDEQILLAKIKANNAKKIYQKALKIKGNIQAGDYSWLFVKDYACDYYTYYCPYVWTFKQNYFDEETNTYKEISNKRFVISPSDAVVASIHQEQGSNIWAGDAAFTLIDPNTLVTKVPLSEEFIQYIEIGSDVNIQISSSDTLVTGKVININPISIPGQPFISIDNKPTKQNISFEVTLSMNNKNFPIFIGSSALATIILNKPIDLMAVPKNAINHNDIGEYLTVISPEGDEYQVYVNSSKTINDLTVIYPITSNSLFLGDVIKVNNSIEQAQEN